MARRYSLGRRFGAVVLCVELLALCVAGSPALAAPRATSSGPISEKLILDEASIAAPGLWSIANGTLQTGAATYVSALTWTGADTNHSLNVRLSTDGLHYTNKVTLAESSGSRPAILAVSPAGPFLLAWTGTDAQHSLNLLYDAYGARRKLTLRETAIGGPSLATLGGKVYLAWTGADTGHSLNVESFTVNASGQFVSGAKVILSQYHSDWGPMLVADPHTNGQLLLTWTYRSGASADPNAINEAYSSDGAHWTTPLAAPPPQTSVAGPAILATSGQGVAPYYWAWSGTDRLHSLNVINADSPLGWPAPVTTLSEQSSDSPALGYSGAGSLGLLAWTGVDTGRHLNIATFSLAAPPPVAATCSTTQLSVSLASSSGAAGHLGQQYQFQNRSAQTCTLDGYPGAQLLDANHASLATHVTQTPNGYMFRGASPALVTLPPGGRAYFVVEWSDVPSGTGPCPAAAYLQLTPPGDQSALVVASAITACRGDLILSPVEPSPLLPLPTGALPSAVAQS